MFSRIRRTHTTDFNDQAGKPFYQPNSKYLLLFACLFCFSQSNAQIGGSGSGLNNMKRAADEPMKLKEYELAGITVTGAKYLDQDLLIGVTNLVIGQKLHLPNDEGLAKAIKALWKQELFSNVQIPITKYIDDKVFINIAVEERPRLSKYVISKTSRLSEAKELKNRTALVTNKVVTEATKKEASERIRKYYTDKGYGRVQIDIQERSDTGSVNKVMLVFAIDKGSKTHINQVNIVGS